MEIETVAAALLDDLLAVVLSRLPVRSLAATRGVCKAWRDLIDERQLLLRFRRLLPHSVRGLFINYHSYPRPQFLSRPTSSTSPAADDGHRRFDGNFDFIQLECARSWYEVLDHCNGLVLIRESGQDDVLHVCNPATRWSAPLPLCQGRSNDCHYYSAWDWSRRAFLVFDPFVSPEYKVLLSPERGWMESDGACHLMEWPPSAWKAWHEFSSRTGRWHEKVFVREDGHGDLLPNKWSCLHVGPPYRYAAYWKGALYIHCPGEFVSRLSLLDDKYRVIKSPIELADRAIKSPKKFADWKTKVPSILGRSEKGVYMAAFTDDALTRLQVWILCESSNNQMEWVPRDQRNLNINTYTWCLENNKFDEQKYWIAIDLEPEYGMVNNGDDGRKTQDVSLEQNVCWNSDDDNIIEVSDDEQEVQPYAMILGFHPYKEVIFLCCSDNVVAFHLSGTKVQYLGTVNQGKTYGKPIQESFVYTPCLIGD